MCQCDAIRNKSAGCIRSIELHTESRYPEMFVFLSYDARIEHLCPSSQLRTSFDALPPREPIYSDGMENCINFAKWPLIKWRWRLLKSKKENVPFLSRITCSPIRISHLAYPARSTILLTDLWENKEVICQFVLFRVYALWMCLCKQKLSCRVLWFPFSCVRCALTRMFAPHT